VPKHGAGVYTIWHLDGRFIYVGMSGRSITKDTAIRNTPFGIYTRLRSHAAGRRSGDLFCVYVADRLVLPTLSQSEIASIAAGEHQMDAFVRRFIHENLSYRFAVLPGDWDHGKPFLNPHSGGTGPGSSVKEIDAKVGLCASRLQ
jgi:hypothetical protein